MPTFNYWAKDTQGKKVSGTMDANDYAEVYLKLDGAALRSVRIVEKNPCAEKVIKQKMPIKKFYLFCRQLAIMISSGLSIVQIFHNFSMQDPSAKYRALYKNIYDSLQKGEALNEILGKQGEVFPTLFVNMVKVGELGGSLDEIALRMADYYEQKTKMKRKIQSGLLYSQILLFALVALVIGVFGWVLPSFFQVFIELDMKLPAVTRFVIALTDFISRKWYVIVLVAVVLWLLWQLITANEDVKYFLDYSKAKLPVIKHVVQKIETANFSSTLGLMYGNGVSMFEALESSVEVVGNRYYKQSLERTVKRVSTGNILSQTLEEEGIFEPMVSALIYVGEESGTLEEVLKNMSVFYQEEAEAAVEKLVKLIEPMILLFIMLPVMVLIVSSILLPSFSLAIQVTEAY